MMGIHKGHPETYSEPCQTSMKEIFYKNGRLSTIFQKNLHHGCLTGF